VGEGDRPLPQNPQDQGRLNDMDNGKITSLQVRFPCQNEEDFSCQVFPEDIWITPGRSETGVFQIHFRIPVCPVCKEKHLIVW
jgi:hypothetical protein